MQRCDEAEGRVTMGGGARGESGAGGHGEGELRESRRWEGPWGRRPMRAMPGGVGRQRGEGKAGMWGGRGGVRRNRSLPGGRGPPVQQRVRAARGGGYRAGGHKGPSSGAGAGRRAADTAVDAVVGNLAIRPAEIL